MNAKISVFVICVEAIIYFLLYNLHDCTFKQVDICWEAQELSVMLNVLPFKNNGGTNFELSQTSFCKINVRLNF